MIFIRPEVTGRRAELSSTANDIGHNRGRPLEAASWIELEKHVSVPEAAHIKGISPDTFKRGMSIEGAIRYLAPPRANSSPMSAVKQVIRSEGSKPEEPSGNRQKVTHLDLLALWDKAPL